MILPPPQPLPLHDRRRLCNVDVLGICISLISLILMSVASTEKFAHWDIVFYIGILLCVIGLAIVIINHSVYVVQERAHLRRVFATSIPSPLP